MVIVQAVLALISRSLGSIMSALFGWAVVALFGPTNPREKMWLSALVGAAARDGRPDSRNGERGDLVGLSGIRPAPFTSAGVEDRPLLPRCADNTGGGGVVFHRVRFGSGAA